MEYEEVNIDMELLQQKLDTAFDVVFQEVMKQKKNPKQKLPTYQKDAYVQLGI
jgi:hypothetical protein